MIRGLGEGLFWAVFWATLLLLHRRESALPASWRPAWADFFMLAAALPIFLALAALTGRPLLAGGLFLVPALLLYFFNRVKVAALREPLVFADVQMGRQLFFFPRFYWPYIPLSPLLAGATALAALSVALNQVDYLLSDQTRLFCAAVSLWLAWAVYGADWRRFPLSFDPVSDGQRYGLIGAALISGLWQSRFGLAEIGPQVKPSADGLAEICVWPGHLRRPLGKAKPHIILVQAESFFHLRRLFPDLGPGWTDNFDRLSAEGRSGRLEVAAYGAYTVRTEFAVLTGLAEKCLGSFKFNPYSLAAGTAAAGTAIGSLPRWLAGQGYESVCLHPGHPDFFRRAQALPNLGFRRFISAEAFRKAERYGPYVSDAAVLEKLAAELRSAAGPKFFFVITLEAHGPWPPGRLKGLPKDIGEPLRGVDPDGGLAAYARHLRHADILLGGLAGLDLDRPLVLGWYGDHVGSLPRGWELAGEQKTDFLIWRRHWQPQVLSRPIPPEQLGALLLGALEENHAA